jgi:hypothetical protein
VNGLPIRAMWGAGVLRLSALAVRGLAEQGGVRRVHHPPAAPPTTTPPPHAPNRAPAHTQPHARVPAHAPTHTHPPTHPPTHTHTQEARACSPVHTHTHTTHTIHLWVRQQGVEQRAQLLHEWAKGGAGRLAPAQQLRRPRPRRQ